MDDRYARIMTYDTRNRMIPCGDCSFEEDEMPEPDHQHEPPEHIVQQLARHEAWIHEIRDSSTRMIAEQGRDLKWMIEHMEKLGATIEKIDARQDRMESELSKHNNFQKRLQAVEETHENLADNYIPRTEFDAAMQSVRESVTEKVNAVSGRFSLLVWIIGAGFGVSFTALGFIIFGG